MPRGCKTLCPLYPQKRTSLSAADVSALCQNRTFGFSIARKSDGQEAETFASQSSGRGHHGTTEYSGAICLTAQLHLLMLELTLICALPFRKAGLLKHSRDGSRLHTIRSLTKAAPIIRCKWMCCFPITVAPSCGRLMLSISWPQLGWGASHLLTLRSDCLTRLQGGYGVLYESKR
jgi:hypothetical protein